MDNKINSGSKETTNEVYGDLNNFSEARNSVKDLINYKKSVLDVDGSDLERIKEFKEKAINAINELFEEYSSHTGKK